MRFACVVWYAIATSEINPVTPGKMWYTSEEIMLIIMVINVIVDLALKHLYSDVSQEVQRFYGLVLHRY